MNKLPGAVMAGLLSVLAGCGGGSGDSASGSSTSDGVSSGVITGFGSVFVNGVRFDTDNATIIRSGEQLNDVRDLSVGMRVVVTGDMNGTVANEVNFEEDVKGPVDAVAGDTLTVLGQTVITDAATVFDNVAKGNIQPGDVVEVSGLRDGDDDLIASFVELKNVDAIQKFNVTGNVRQLDTAAMTFMIDDLVVNYSGADVSDLPGGVPVEGQLVEVKDEAKAYVAGSQQLFATKVEPQASVGDGFAGDVPVELASIVSAVNLPNGFELANAVEVRLTPATVFVFGSAGSLATGVRVQVRGTLNDAGVLTATRVRFRSNSARIEAPVDSVDVAGNKVVMLGIPIQLNENTRMKDRGQGTGIDSIQSGDFLEVRGFLGADDQVVATRVEHEEIDDGKVELRGPVSQANEGAGTLTILGIAVSTDGNTEFEGAGDMRISRDIFFAAVEEGLTIVEVEWENFVDTNQPVREAELEDAFDDDPDGDGSRDVGVGDGDEDGDDDDGDDEEDDVDDESEGGEDADSEGVEDDDKD